MNPKPNINILVQETTVDAPVVEKKKKGGKRIGAGRPALVREN